MIAIESVSGESTQTADSPYLELMKYKRIVDEYLLRIMVCVEPQVQIISN